MFWPFRPLYQVPEYWKIVFRGFWGRESQKVHFEHSRKMSFGDIDMLIVVRWKNRRMTQNAVGTQQKLSSIKSWFLVVLSLAVVQMHSALIFYSWGY